MYIIIYEHETNYRYTAIATYSLLQTYSSPSIA